MVKQTHKDGTPPWEVRGRGEAKLWYRHDEVTVEQSQAGQGQNRANRRIGRACQSKYLPTESGRVGNGEFRTSRQNKDGVRVIRI